MTKTVTHIVALVAVCSVLFGYQYLSAEWTEPAQTPPNGNVDAPVNTGSTAQVKNGALSADAMAVFGDVAVTGTSSLSRVLAAAYCDENGENCESGGGSGITIHTVSMETYGQAMNANQLCQMAGYDGYFNGMDGSGTESIRCFTSDMVEFETCQIVTAQYNNNGTVYTRYYPASLDITHLVTSWSTSNSASFSDFDIRVRKHSASGDSQGFGLYVGRDTPTTDRTSSRPFITVLDGLDSVTHVGEDEQNNVPMYMTYERYGSCLQTEVTATGNDLLVNGNHTALECVEAGGEVRETSEGVYACRFKRSSCPSGWSSYGGWSAWTGRSCRNSGSCTGGCTVSDKLWGNYGSTPSCTYIYKRGEQCDNRGTRTCSASRSEIGCY